jgi:hydrogenase expression/formation protein HypE
MHNTSTPKKILLGHGSGGKLSAELIEKVFLPAFGNPYLAPLGDQAVVNIDGVRVAFTTDSYVVNPIFFPGGSIGDLAVNGTVNDLAVGGAKPLYISAGLILEEGMPGDELERIVKDMQKACERAGVMLVTGDTKVVEKGKGDKIFINTSGIGTIGDGIAIDPKNVRPGDKIIINGNIGSHGIAILSVREGLAFETTVTSDTAPLNGLVQDMLNVTKKIRWMRDPTRGGVSSTMNELAKASGAGIVLHETELPLEESVKAACEILGLDPLYVANEGKVLAVVPPDEADAVLEAVRANPLGANARIIGEITDENRGYVLLKTSIGGNRVVDMLAGEQLPRIC